MGRRKRSRAEAHPPPNDITAELPPEMILFHILPRLPVKSVLRFTSVSKQWQPFLTTPAFVKMHLHHINTHKMVVISATTPYKFHTIDCERPEEGFSAGRRVPFKIGRRQRIRILTSVHGQVCVAIRNTLPLIRTARAEYSDLILWNPATGDYKTLCKTYLDNYFNIRECLFGLYHSEDDDDYKLLRVTRHPHVYIYSLKSDSWRKVESGLQRSRISDQRFSSIWGPSVSLSENMYFLERVNGRWYSIMRFNKKTETLKEIATPFLSNDDKGVLSFEILRDGCIQLWVNVVDPATLSSENELWRMEGDGDWRKLVNSGEVSCGYIRHHHRLHLRRSGNDLVMYDPKGGCVYQLDVNTNAKEVCSNTTEKMLVWPGGKYIESMVSPNLYN